MNYIFYPGCSMEGSALEYKSSTLAVLQALGIELQEIEDWTCCGASVAPVMSDLLGLALPARNLALAEAANAPQKNGGAQRDLLVACSACYTNFRRTAIAAANPKVREKINQALEVEGLIFHNTLQARHLLDVIANDIGPEAIAARVKRPLKGLKVAPYYGCQTVRPYSPYDDSQRPNSMVGILEALGAEVHHYAHEATCCGTALLTTKPEVGLGMVGEILEAASPADCVAAVCPMCHMNLDSYQGKVAQVVGKPLNVPILFLPQLMGLAFELPESDLLLKRHVVSAAPVMARLAPKGGMN
jgi:heterodisulfide reductase subunit B